MDVLVSTSRQWNTNIITSMADFMFYFCILRFFKLNVKRALYLYIFISPYIYGDIKTTQIAFTSQNVSLYPKTDHQFKYIKGLVVKNTLI